MVTEVNQTLWEKTLPLRVLSGLLFILGALTLWLWPILPVADDVSYFNFADKSEIFGVPHSLDVLSNGSFLFIGLWGLYACFKKRKNTPVPHLVLAATLAVASLLTSVGSSYFHWVPGTERLFWDRLPMTIGFSAIVALLIADRIDQKLGLWSAAALIPFGIVAVVGWNAGWLTLKPYLVVQYGSLLFIFLLVSLRQANLISNARVGASMGFYLLAKVFELLDSVVLKETGFISGHPLKHIFAALAILKILAFLKGE